MKFFILKLNAILKGLTILFRPHVLFGFLQKPLLFLSNTLALSKWAATQHSKIPFNDFFTLTRNYNKRLQLFEYIASSKSLTDVNLCYIELGVFEGHSFKWWANHLKNTDTRLFGFDTFEGLPEQWGMYYDKGEMHAVIPELNDSRVAFFKGLFQETLPVFIEQHKSELSKQKIIHFDADLFSSTLYSMAMLYPYLRKGDILLFDEFNVPNHEFFAFKMIQDSFYLKTKLIGAVNNYYQVAFEII